MFVYNLNKKLIFLIFSLILLYIIMYLSKKRRIDNQLIIETIETYSPSEHLIILDWDDTILPTTDISDNEYIENKDLMESSNNFLSLCIKLSRKVYIITNAEMGWIETSSKKYLPNIIPLLSQCVIISARSENEKQFPNNQYMWKYTTFKKIIEYEDSTSPLKSITSIGDSYNNEYLALKTLQNENKSNWISHKIKTMDNPSINNIINIHKVLTKTLPKLLELPYSQDLVIYKDDL